MKLYQAISIFTIPTNELNYVLFHNILSMHVTTFIQMQMTICRWIWNMILSLFIITHEEMIMKSPEFP